jgi:hypothetical protein
MEKTPIAEDILSKKFNELRSSFTLKDVEECMIEFAKLHVEKIKELQMAKYFAGETGYIKKEEWEEILNNIK